MLKRLMFAAALAGFFFLCCWYMMSEATSYVNGGL